MLIPSGGRLCGALAAVVLLIGCTAAAKNTAALTPPATGPAAPLAATSAASTADAVSSDRRFSMLEEEFDATVGVYALDTGSGRSVTFRADRRFPYASTFKALQAGVLLKQRSDHDLDKVIRYQETDLEEYSPITKDHVDTGLSLRQLADASVRYSDNTAANLLFRELGGPRAVDAALARIGDRTTHMDRIEPELNSAVPGDIRDTSTPRALGTDLRKFVLGKTLNDRDKAVLTDLLRRNTTGDRLIRAGVPTGWVVGDKTGAGSYATRNDIAVLWPPKAAPIVVAILSTRDVQDAPYDDALIARTAEVVVDALK